MNDLAAGWKACRLKDVADFVMDLLPATTDPAYEFRYLDIGNVSNGEIVETELMTFAEAPSRARKRIQPGDTILSTVRTYLRAIALIEGETADLVVSTGFAVLRPRSGLLPEFLFRALQSQEFIQQVVSHSEGVSYPAIRPRDLMALPFSYPEDKLIQAALLSVLEAKVTGVEQLIRKKKEAIERLIEYRTALVSAAVTGKIDVRGVL